MGSTMEMRNPCILKHMNFFLVGGLRESKGSISKLLLLLRLVFECGQASIQTLMLLGVLLKALW